NPGFRKVVVLEVNKHLQCLIDRSLASVCQALKFFSCINRHDVVVGFLAVGLQSFSILLLAPGGSNPLCNLVSPNGVGAHYCKGANQVRVACGEYWPMRS